MGWSGRQSVYEERVEVTTQQDCELSVLMLLTLVQTRQESNVLLKAELQNQILNYLTC